MALGTGSFGPAALPYLPALLPDAATQAVLAAGAQNVNLFSYPNLVSTGPRLISLRSFQTQAVAGVNTQLTADGYQTPWNPTQASTLIGALSAGPAMYYTPATNQLRMQLQNLGGNPGDLYWSNWGVLVEAPTIAQKLKFPGKLGALSDAETQLASKLGLLPPAPRGVLPRTFDWIVANEFATQINAAAVLANQQTVSSVLTPMVQDQAADGEVLVLAWLGCSPGSGSDGLSVVVQVDNIQTFLQINGYGLGSGVGAPCFVIAAQQIAVALNSTSSVANANLQAVIWHCRLTDEIAVRLGQVTEGPVYDKVTSGVL